jgi:hypothetical protein
VFASRAESLLFTQISRIDRFSSATGPQPKGTAEDAVRCVIGVIRGLLGCPQITQKTQM